MYFNCTKNDEINLQKLFTTRANCSLGLLILMSKKTLCDFSLLYNRTINEIDTHPTYSECYEDIADIPGKSISRLSSAVTHHVLCL